MDIHDAHGLALLIVGAARTNSARLKPDREQQRRRSAAHQRQDSAAREPHETGGIGETGMQARAEFLTLKSIATIRAPGADAAAAAKGASGSASSEQRPQQQQMRAAG